MTYKNTMAINKTWPQVEASGFSLAGVITRLCNAVKFEIPVGYQDESGFHCGTEPASKEIKWPSVS
jgi:hypothetical protein